MIQRGEFDCDELIQAHVMHWPNCLCFHPLPAHSLIHLGKAPIFLITFFRQELQKDVGTVKNQ